MGTTHLQLVMFCDPRGEKEFEGHKEHVAEEILANSAEYFPPAHRVHADEPLMSWLQI
jgi:hypothetical protein